MWPVTSGVRPFAMQVQGDLCARVSARADAVVPVTPAQKEGGKRTLSLTRQLIGNLDEVTDLRLLGQPGAAPSHVALATNSPILRLFNTATLSCTATLAGHSDTVLALDATHAPGAAARASRGTLGVEETACGATCSAASCALRGARRFDRCGIVQAGTATACCVQQLGFLPVLQAACHGGKLAPGTRDCQHRAA